MWKLKQIFDGEYGCEERQPGEKEKCLVILANEEGEEKTFEANEDWIAAIEKLSANPLMKIIISKPMAKDCQYKKIVVEKKGDGYQAAKYTEIRHMKVQMLGLDLKKDVIEKCNRAAEKYGYDDLRFELGDINGFQTPFDVDMVVTLHACDTATDFALYNAITWNAKMIFSVPCCQHEVNKQIQSEDYSLLTRYGIIKERFSALTTDAIRANLLECCGYKTQLLEFIDFEHTPKNILIRAVRRPVLPSSAKKKYLAEVENMCREFHLEPTLYTLLRNDCKV